MTIRWIWRNRKDDVSVMLINGNAKDTEALLEGAVGPLDRGAWFGALPIGAVGGGTLWACAPSRANGTIRPERAAAWGLKIA